MPVVAPAAGHDRPGRGRAGWRHRSSTLSSSIYYDGPVYDLEVADTHTYVANGSSSTTRSTGSAAPTSRNIMEFEEAFPDATVIVLEQNYRSTQTILDAANAVIANNVGRKPKELWTEAGEGDAIIRYHADDEADEAQWVAHEIMHAPRLGATRWGDVAVFYRTNAQSRVLEEHLMRVGDPLQGGRRHPLLRPARGQGRAGLPEGGGEPGRRGQRQAGAQRAQARRRRLHRSPGSTPGPPATASPFIEALRRARRRRGHRAGGEGHRGVPRSCSTTWPMLVEPTGAGRGLLEAAAATRSAATSPSSRPSTRSRRRAASRTWPSWSARPASSTSVDEFLEQISLVADTDELDDDDSRSCS